MRGIAAALFATLFVQAESPIQSLVVGTQSIVLAAPEPFVEVSRVFPEGFKLRQETIPQTNRLLAWLIPAPAVKDRLNGAVPTYRTLQVQVLTPMIQPTHDSAAMATIARELRARSDQLPALAQQALDEVLRKPKFEELQLQMGLERSLGVLDEGPDFVTLGAVVFAQTAGRQVSSRLTLTSFFLVRGKILLLVVSGREASAAELVASSAILGEWRAAMRLANRSLVPQP